MTLQTFEKLIQAYEPRFRIRQAGYGDIVGCFLGNDYLLRLNKGDIPLYSWRDKLGKRKRGRMQALGIMVNHRILTQQQAQKIMWGYHE